MPSSAEVYINKSESKSYDDFIISEVPGDYSEKVAAITINDILSLAENESIDILKIDIEGSERKLFLDNYHGCLKLK